MQNLIYANGYSFRRTITISKLKVSGGADISNFILRFVTTQDFLKSAANSGELTSALGYDMIFTDTNDAILPFEIITYNPVSGNAIIDIKINLLNATDTQIRLYTGNNTITTSQENKASLWSNYWVVWHGFGGGTTVTDATTNGHTLTKKGLLEPNEVTGKIYLGQQYDGVNDYSTFVNIATSTNPWTVQMWLKPTSNSIRSRFLNTNNWFTAFYEAAATTLTWFIGDGTTLSAGASTANAIAYNIWQMLHFSNAGSGAGNGKFYRNGASLATQSSPGLGSQTQNPSYLGAQNTAANWYKGIIEEFRISKSELSSGYIATEYTNQNDAVNFCSIGALDMLPLQALSQGTIRPPKVSLQISFDKTFDASIDLFTIGTSKIASGDIIPGSGDVVQEWDKYVYVEYADRVITIEWSREVNEYASVATAMADFTLDNHDGLFDPNGTSPLAQYILPGRPVRIGAGFGNETVPVFIGITDGMPIIDEKARTVTFHCIDFFSTLLRQALEPTPLYANQRADQVIESILTTNFGLLAAQLDLSTGLSIIPFIFFDAGITLFDAFNKLMEAEGGRLFMTENGVITFRNRQEYDTNVVMDFSPYTNIKSSITRTKDDIINAVVIQGASRTVQILQQIGSLTNAQIIHAGETITLSVPFGDPVTTADDPILAGPNTDSYFTVNSQANGSGASSTNVTLISSALYAKSKSLTFKNSGLTDLYITNVTIFGTPASINQDIYVSEQDSDSVTKYGEHLLTINNDFFQSTTEAQSKALIVVNTFAPAGSVNTLDVKGTPAIQLDDAIQVNMYGRVSTGRIIKMSNKITQPINYIQIYNIARLISNANYFTIQQSLIGDTDQIAP